MSLYVGWSDVYLRLASGYTFLEQVPQGETVSPQCYTVSVCPITMNGDSEHLDMVMSARFLPCKVTTSLCKLISIL